MKKLLSAFIITAMLLSITACGNANDDSKTDSSYSDVKDKANDVKDDAEKGMKDAGDDIKDTVKDAGDDIKDTAEDIVK